MTNCTQAVLEFPPLKRRKIQAEFTGGDITSDGGVLLLRQIDRQLGLLKAVDAAIPDPRDTRYIEHAQLSLLRQHIYGIALGYEDLNVLAVLAALGVILSFGRGDFLKDLTTIN